MGFRHLAVVLGLALGAWPTASFADEAARRALAREVMDLSGSEEGMVAGWRAGMPMVREGLIEAGYTPAEANQYVALYEQEVASRLPSLMAAAVEVYAEMFSEEELTGMRDFFLTPPGQAMRREMEPLSVRMQLLANEAQESIMRAVDAQMFAKHQAE